MHLMIPFASAALSEPGLQALRSLKLPHLSALLSHLTATSRIGTDEDSFNTPAERAQAAEFGWEGGDGALPWAAHAAAQDGIDAAAQAWGQLTPVHWHVAADHISVPDPAHLQLSSDDSHTLFEAVRPLFETEGLQFAWGAPLRWYAAHDSFDDLPCASLDRVIGRSIDRWMPSRPEARLVRRLQNEVQMLLYQHPLNDARLEGGSLPVNSFWLSGCGRRQPVPEGPAMEIDNRLRTPFLSQDWAAWCEAWQELDATVLKEALSRLDEENAAFSLTLAGERHAQGFAARPRSWLARLKSRVLAPPSATSWIEAL